LNTISHNKEGIRLKGAVHNKVFKNTIENNEERLVCCCSAKDNILYQDVFKQNNKTHACDPYNNMWSYNRTGNYWDDYEGVDEDGDEI